MPMSARPTTNLVPGGLSIRRPFTVMFRGRQQAKNELQQLTCPSHCDPTRFSSHLLEWRSSGREERRDRRRHDTWSNTTAAAAASTTGRMTWPDDGQPLRWNADREFALPWSSPYQLHPRTASRQIGDVRIAQERDRGLRTPAIGIDASRRCQPVHRSARRAGVESRSRRRPTDRRGAPRRARRNRLGRIQPQAGEGTPAADAMWQSRRDRPAARIPRHDATYPPRSPSNWRPRRDAMFTPV